MGDAGVMGAVALPPWAVVSPKRAEHIGRVVALVDRWAQARGVAPAEAGRWHRAALLHDALRDAGPDVLARYAPRGEWHEALWHGPAAAVAAERDGERDRGVLDAIRYHTVGFAGWDDAGRIVYLADFLEPGRTFKPEWCAQLAARVPAEQAAVLAEVAASRIGWLLTKRERIQRETWDFWNSLAGDASSS